MVLSINHTVVNNLAHQMPIRNISFLSSLFEKTLYHGTSVAAVGEKQLHSRQFFPRGECNSWLWATTDRQFAEKYALRSSERTGSKPILVVVEGPDMEYVPYGKHSYPAMPTNSKQPVKITKIIEMD